MIKQLPLEDREHIMLHGKNAFEALRNARIFITG